MSDLVVKASSDDVGLRRESAVDAGGLPLWLARLHQAVPAGTALRLSIEGKLPVSMDTLIEGAGFADNGQNVIRQRTLPDLVSPGMRLLISGLNPSLRAADAGVGFVTKGNRFWPAMMAAGLVTADRKPAEALLMHGVGFTDLAKRATAKADELTPAEFAAGLSRLDRLCTWLRPKTLVMVGLTGWRHATDRSASAGWQETRLGDTPVYLMPNTSGLNTHVSLDQLTEHFLEAAAGPPA